jgi:hypothetical protein
MMRRSTIAWMGLGVMLAAGGAAVARAADAQPVAAAAGLRGAWRAETYELRDGARHTVDGLIFFSERDWTVLFFVLDAEGQPQRGSGEGGTYTLEGDRLVFSHRLNLSAGRAMAGLPEEGLRMVVRGAAGNPAEPCRIDLTADRLAIHFPSGNTLRFSRSSGF